MTPKQKRRRRAEQRAKRLSGSTCHVDVYVSPKMLADEIERLLAKVERAERKAEEAYRKASMSQQKACFDRGYEEGRADAQRGIYRVPTSTPKVIL